MKHPASNGYIDLLTLYLLCIVCLTETPGCQSGTFGENCAFKCHCEGGPIFCEKDGFCLKGCEAGWAGYTCQTECIDGRFGVNCKSTCHCLENSTALCDKVTGVCEGGCEAGYMGNNCQTKCPQNKYGVNCTNDCRCLNGGRCNRTNGFCLCEGRWKGQACNESIPQILTATNEEINVGQQAVISCTAEATPVPEIEISSATGDYEARTRTLKDNQYQAFVKLNPKEAGQMEFRCNASNQHGFDMRDIILTVIEPPKLNSAPWLLSNTNTSITVGWRDWVFSNDTGGSAVDKIEYMVVYRKQGESNWEKVNKWSTELSNTINELTPNTLYEVALKCRRLGKGGEGDASPGLMVKTECGAATKEGLAREVLTNRVTESTARLTWKRPFEDTLRCTLKEYYLSYHLKDDVTIMQEVILDADANSFQFQDLTPNTAYVVRLYAETEVGRSKYFVELTIKTKDTFPGKPSEISILHNGLTTLNLTWKEPIEKNGVLLGYKITYHPMATLDPVFNTTPFTMEVRKVNATVKDIVLRDLHPSTKYKISVEAKTSAGYGPQVNITSWTVISGNHVSPSLRILETNVTNETVPLVISSTESSHVYKYQIIVEWSLHTNPINESLLSDFDTGVVKNNLSYYTAAELYPRNLSRTGEQYFVIGDDKMWGKYKNVRLNPGHEYKIRIRTFVYKDDEIESVLSEATEVSSASTVVRVERRFNKKIAGLDFVVFILIISTVVVLLVVIVTVLTRIFVSIRRRQKKKSTMSLSTQEFRRSESLTFSVMSMESDNEPIGGPLVNEGYKTLSLSDRQASLRRSKCSSSKMVCGVRIESLQDFLTNALATNQLEEEFQRLVDGQIYPWTAARKGSNLKKNRLVNILPYDRHRVVLHTNSRSESDYINASYIDGYRRPREYIVTQAPLSHTIIDFWRMVWQENAPVIVMLTDLVENGKENCTKYWPQDSMMSGDLQILAINSQESSNYIVRTILMRKRGEVCTHRVQQYHFTAWPENAVPSDINCFIKFLKLIRENHPVIGGPIIVHCSTGAGRSGTYIAIDALCQQAAEEKRVEVFRFVNKERQQRAHLVQTLEQYTFIYEAIVEAFQYEDTCVSLNKIGFYLRELNHMSTLDNRALIIKQYNKLNRTQKKVDANMCTAAFDENNIFKNRDLLIVPLDPARVRLHSDDRPELSDYINAVFVDGYRKKYVYITTQMPLVHTIEDFWRMIYVTKSSVVVLLNGPDEVDDVNSGIYWPEILDSKYGDFYVQIISSEERDDFTSRIMRLTYSKNKNEEPHKVIQIQYKGWSSEMKPDSMLKFLHNVELCYLRSPGSPITVHCMDGATRTGLFIATRNIRDQMKAGNSLDVYQEVKRIRANRPEFIPNSDQYRFLFQIAQELHSE